LNLGEGAGFIVLESEKLAQTRESRAYGRLSGYANTNDAYHQTASSPDGEAAFSAMTRALEMSRIKAGEIDYINVHGTGTENNDASEGAALVRVFGEDVPSFSSTKSFTGPVPVIPRSQVISSIKSRLVKSRILIHSFSYSF